MERVRRHIEQLGNRPLVDLLGQVTVDLVGQRIKPQILRRPHRPAQLHPLALALGQGLFGARSVEVAFDLGHQLLAQRYPQSRIEARPRRRSPRRRTAGLPLDPTCPETNGECLSLDGGAEGTVCVICRCMSESVEQRLKD